MLYEIKNSSGHSGSTHSVVKKGGDNAAIGGVFYLIYTITQYYSTQQRIFWWIQNRKIQQYES